MEPTFMQECYDKYVTEEIKERIMKQEIIDKLNECDTMGEVDKILATLEYGTDYQQIDEKIDDGCDDDEEDEYVMKTCYRFFVDGEDEPIEIDFYWGNVTYKIGWIKFPLSFIC